MWEGSTSVVYFLVSFLKLGDTFACISGVQLIEVPFYNIVVTTLYATFQLDIQNSAGAVPLHFVSEVRDGVKLAEFLIRNGAYLNRQTLGLTPLHLAILRNHCHIARLLIRHGADVHLRDHDGNSPLNYAITSEHGVDPDLVQLIMQGGHQPTEGDRRLLAGRLPEIVVSSPEKDLVEWVRECMRKPLDLRELTRVWLRAFLSRRSEGRSIEASVDKLPVPNLIKSYLMLTDFYS